MMMMMMMMIMIMMVIMNYERISGDKMILRMKLKTRILKNNAMKIENIVNSFRKNQYPRNDLELIHIQPLHSCKRLKINLKTKNEQKQ